MDSLNLSSEERNYLFGLISCRLFELQKNSFLFPGERIFVGTGFVFVVIAC